MQHMQEKLHLKAGRLHNVDIAGHKFKNPSVCECGGKVFKSLFKEYQDSLPEGKGFMVFGIFRDIIKLLRMSGESKSGLSTYDIKFHHGKNVFDDMLYRIG